MITHFLECNSLHSISEAGARVGVIERTGESNGRERVDVRKCVGEPASVSVSVRWCQAVIVRRIVLQNVAINGGLLQAVHRLRMERALSILESV